MQHPILLIPSLGASCEKHFRISVTFAFQKKKKKNTEAPHLVNDHTFQQITRIRVPDKLLPDITEQLLSSPKYTEILINNREDETNKKKKIKIPEQLCSVRKTDFLNSSRTNFLHKIFKLL